MTKIEELEQKLNEMKEGLEVGIKKFQEQITDFNNELRIAKEDFLDELNECQKELAELKESKKECKWKPQIGEEYWFRDGCGNMEFFHYDTDHEGDRWRIDNLPIFPTKEACERYWRFMDTVKEKSYEFTELDWKNDDFIKYSISYDFELDEFNINETGVIKYFGEVYFKTKTDARYIIDNFKDELMEYFL